MSPTALRPLQTSVLSRSTTPTVVIPGDDDVIVLPGPETVKWYEKDISLYILLIVIVVIGFALYILYTVWSRRRNE